MKRIIFIIFFFTGILISAQEQQYKSKMTERYSFGFIINVKDSNKVKEFSELSKKYELSLVKYKTYIYIVVAKRDIIEAAEITNAFNELAMKHKLELIMQKLPSKK